MAFGTNSLGDSSDSCDLLLDSVMQHFDWLHELLRLFWDRRWPSLHTRAIFLERLIERKRRRQGRCRGLRQALTLCRRRRDRARRHVRVMPSLHGGARHGRETRDGHRRRREHGRAVWHGGRVGARARWCSRSEVEPCSNEPDTLLDRIGGWDECSYSYMRVGLGS